jgi:hypothetical protein
LSEQLPSSFSGSAIAAEAAPTEEPSASVELLLWELLLWELLLWELFCGSRFSGDRLSRKFRSSKTGAPTQSPSFSPPDQSCSDRTPCGSDGLDRDPKDSTVEFARHCEISFSIENVGGAMNP